MKFLVVLCALVAAGTAAPANTKRSIYAYSPYAYNGYAPAPYFYAPRPITGFSYSVAETAPVVSYAAAPALPYPAPAYAYSAPPAPIVPAAPIVAAPSVAVPVVAEAPVKSQYHSQDELGQARYGHDEPGQSHHAIQDAAGNKYGTFSYIKPDGKVSITQYSADHEGYKVASNDLPVAPGSPAPAQPPAPVVPVVPVEPIVSVVQADPIAPAVVQADPIAPAVVQADPIAPAVVAAPVPAAPAPQADPSDDTIEVENVERSKRDVKSKSRSRRSVVLPNGYLADTPEVAAAKAAHFAEHAKRTSPYFSSPLDYYPYALTGYPYAPIAYSAFPYAAYPYAYPAYAYAPAVTADGYLADTPEVAAAKAAHFAEHAIARSRARRDTKTKRSPAHTPADTAPLVPGVPVRPGYAPEYNAVTYSRPVDPSAPIVPLVPVPAATGVKTPAQAYERPIAH